MGPISLIEFLNVGSLVLFCISLVYVMYLVLMGFAHHSEKRPDNMGQILAQNLLKTALIGIIIAGGSLLIFHFIDGYSLTQLRGLTSPTFDATSTPLVLNNGIPTISVATSTAKKPDIPSTSDSLQLFNLMNTVRTVPFIYDSGLEQIATARALYLCKTNTFSHDNFKDFFEDSPFNWVGEDLAKSYASEQGVFSAFMQSPPHKAQIQNTQYQYVGVAENCGITVVSFGGYDTN